MEQKNQTIAANSSDSLKNIRFKTEIGIRNKIILAPERLLIPIIYYLLKRT